MSYTFEVCVDSVASAIAAEQGGGTRLELCANYRLVLYNDHEFKVMNSDVSWMLKMNVHGIVIGLLMGR